ncbi:MAG: hypothetical protein GEV08_05210 [Acidimicrobiia bacterium]|nr:hypothetical protein [Acidimicrobiia bacterium]
MNPRSGAKATDSVRPVLKVEDMPAPAPPPGWAERSSAGRGDWLVASLFALAGGLGAGLFAARGGGGAELVLVSGACTGLVVAVVAATRFWAVVVALFVVRASLDALKLGSFGNTTNAFDPSVVVGLAFLLSGSLWLFAQWRAGPWHRPSRTTMWFAALAAAGVFSAAGSENPVQSGQVGLKICAGALMFAVLEQAYRHRPDRVRHVLAAGAASLVVPALVAIGQSQSSEVEQYIEVSRIRGTFVHANPFATFLVILAVVAVAVRPHLRGGARLAATAVMATSSTLVLFTYARGAWVALILGLVVIGFKQDRRILVGLASLVIVVVIAVPSVTARLSDLSAERVEGRGDPNSLAWRFGYWGRLLPEVAESPVTGIGLEQVLAHSEEGLQPHNVFVQTVVETGLLGLTCLVGLCVSMATELRRAMRRASPGLHRGVAIGAAAAAVGLFAQLLSENLLTQAAIHWYLAAPVAFAVALYGSPARDDGAEALEAR